VDHPNGDDELNAGDEAEPAREQAEDEPDTRDELRVDGERRHELGRGKTELRQEFHELVHTRGREDVVVALVDQESAGDAAQHQQSNIRETRVARQE